jgi:cell wall-associated NlpC family hydrolase
VTTVKTVTAVPKVLTAAQKKAAAKKAAAKKAAAIKAKKKAKAKAKRAKIIKIAKKYRGVRYVFGGASPAAGFDCSGYTKYVYKKAINMTLPHSANGQAHKGRKVSAKNAKAGDLVIYSYPYSANFHVAIYVSKNKTIAAQKPGRVTGITNLFWGSGESHKYVDVIDPSVGL